MLGHHSRSHFQGRPCPSRLSYLGSSGDAREGSSQEYTNLPNPGRLGPRKQPKSLPWPLLLAYGGSLFWRSILGGPCMGFPRLTLLLLHLVLALTLGDPHLLSEKLG